MRRISMRDRAFCDSQRVRRAATAPEGQDDFAPLRRALKSDDEIEARITAQIEADRCNAVEAAVDRWLRSMRATPVDEAKGKAK